MNVAEAGAEMVLGMLARRRLRPHRDRARPPTIPSHVRRARERRDVCSRARSQLARASNAPGPAVRSWAITGCNGRAPQGAIASGAPYVDLVTGPTATGASSRTSEGRPRRPWTTRTRPLRDYEGRDPSREMTGGVTATSRVRRGCDSAAPSASALHARPRTRTPRARILLRQARAMPRPATGVQLLVPA